MLLTLFLLLQTPTPTKPESVLWTYRPGQEFFVEETQRQLLQIKGAVTLSSYFDYTYLWRYFVKNGSPGELILEATLDKVRVNNPNEAGGRASEKMKLTEGSKSLWILKKGNAGWTIQRTPEDAGKHAIPCFLTLGTPRLDESPAGWKQAWDMPVADWGQAKLLLAATVKQQSGDHLLVTTKGQLEWTASNDKQTQVTVMSQNNPIAGLGDFDLTRGKWLFCEWRADGTWKITRAGVTSTMKQDLYCNYRYYERRPTFP